MNRKLFSPLFWQIFWPLFCALSLGTLFPAALASAAPPPPSLQQLLADSDRARGGLLGGLTWSVELDSTEDGNQIDRKFDVKTRDTDALVEATDPPRNKGEVFLFNDRTMWFFKPGLRKPLAISARQKLSGQAANGDIASTLYSRDYDGAVVRTEKVDGTPTYVLELKAGNKNVTYDRIRYWISQTMRLAVKAEFLTLEGEVFKSATFEYGNHLAVSGKNIPFISRMTIQDAHNPANRSRIDYRKPRAEAHPASLFNINNVVR